MANQTGIEIHIKAWLPTGKGLDEQFTALSLVKAAHESGDYAPLLKAASIEAVKTESKTRRMEAQPEPQAQSENPTSSTSDLPNDTASPSSTASSDQPAPESNVGDAPVDQPSLVPDEETLPNPIKHRRRAA